MIDQLITGVLPWFCLRNDSPMCVNIDVSNIEFNAICHRAKDWVTMHGILVKSKQNHNADQVHTIPFLLLPSSYPRKEFKSAKELQTILNELMHKVAHDYEFLSNTLKTTIEVDYFTSKLYDIYNTVYLEGFTQNISLGLIRSDYMLHNNVGNRIKQVEINMIASSFGGLSVQTTEYHKFILTELGCKDKIVNIPENNADSGLSAGLLEAWNKYNNRKAVILFVVEDITYNIFDQRALEFIICKLNPDVKVIRRSLTELVVEANLGLNKELLVGNLEIAVVYFRSGYGLEAYPTEKEWDVRLLLERSQAIKCPSIQYHLAGTKKVQQELSVPGTLEKFVTDPIKIRKIREIFMGLYSLDFNQDGENAINMAINDFKNYVLKPQREGGGNNVYDEEIKLKLEAMRNSKDRTAWILMERIYPPLQENCLIHAGDKDLKMQKVVSELGIYGVLMGDQSKIMLNKQVGHVLRTKPFSNNEGGIVSGAGALDSPYLVD